RQLHHVKETARRVVAPHMQDADHARMRTRNRFKLNDPVKLAFVRSFDGKILTPNHLDGAKLAGGAPRQPDIAVTGAANAREQRVIGDPRRNANRLRLAAGLSRGRIQSPANPVSHVFGFHWEVRGERREEAQRVKAQSSRESPSFKSQIPKCFARSKDCSE